MMRLITRITAGEEEESRYSHLKEKQCKVEGTKKNIYNLVYSNIMHPVSGVML